jgi:excisionase family DNA binding protein
MGFDSNPGRYQQGLLMVKQDKTPSQEEAAAPVEATGPNWLSIAAAAAYLGVSQGTLRRWTDEGRVATFLTPGGHRRYDQESLQKLVAGNSTTASGRPRVSRQQITDRSLSAYAEDYVREARNRPWFKAFGSERQEEHRRLGRQLVDLAIRYASNPANAERQRLLDEGRKIGAYYGQSAAQARLGPAETIEAFLYFRFPTVRAVLGVIEDDQLPARRAARLFIGIDDFIDQILLEMMRAYEPLESS